MARKLSRKVGGRKPSRKVGGRKTKKASKKVNKGDCKSAMGDKNLTALCMACFNTASLSENCFFNEYIFITTNKEKNFLIKLKDLIKKSKEILELEIGILGSYIPIGSIESIKKKLERFESKNS